MGGVIHKTRTKKLYTQKDYALMAAKTNLQESLKENDIEGIKLYYLSLVKFGYTPRETSSKIGKAFEQARKLVEAECKS